MKYSIDIVQTRVVGVEIVAKDYDEAREIATEMYDNDEFDMGQNGPGEMEVDIYDEEEECS